MKTFIRTASKLKIFLPAIIGFLQLTSPGSAFAQAPTISYSSPQTYIAGGPFVTLSATSTGVAAPAFNSAAASAGSGFSTPGGLAIDAAGNIYVADNGNNQVKKIAAVGGAITTIGTGFNHPNDVKVDAAGNVYVADAGNNAVKEILVGNGSTVTLATGFNTPSAIALDPVGNIYVADTQNNQVKKVPAGGGTPVSLGFTFNKPNCVATDAAGDLYIIDFNFTLYRIPAAGGAPVTWSSGFNNPKGMVVDAMGNIYIADSGSGFIKRVPAAGGTAVALGPHLNVPAGVATDAVGNVYVSYSSASLAKIKPVGGYYISSALPAGLTFAGTSGGITGTPAAASPAKNYKITVYNSSGGASFTLNLKVNLGAIPTISYSTPQTYTVGTAIAPLSPTSTGVANPGYSSTPTAVATGFNGPEGVAVDAAGNVYVADANNNAVKKIATGGTVTSIGSGFVTPRGVAVDASNNVYIADAGNAVVKKLAGGTGTPVIIGSGFSTPYGVAVDAAKNVYVADNGNKKVIKIPLGTGTPVILGSGFVTPTEVAVDAVGNVYVDDSNGSLVQKIPSTGGSPVIISSGLTSPYGVAVDGAGNLYVADKTNNTISELAAGSGFPLSIGSGFDFPLGVAVDSKGDIFVGDEGNNAVKKIKPVGGYYISPGLPAGLTFNSATGVVSGTPTAASAAKTYTITAWSSGGSKSTTLSITVKLPVLPVVSYATPQTYFTGIAITPLAPSGSGVAAPAYTHSPVNLGSGFNGPQGVAVDASGNVYVADASNNAVKKIPAGGGTPVVIGSGFSFPRDVAIDASGNVFVTDFGHGAVKEIPGGTGAPVTIGSGFSFPWGIAIDASGNLYVSDISSNTVKRIPLVSGSYGTPVILASGFASPYGVAVDAAGNVYVADANNNAVKKIAAVSGTVTSVGSGFGSVSGVRLDGAGNLYVTDKTYNQIKELPAGSNVIDTVAVGFNSPTGIALDWAGVIYVADFNNNLVKQFKPIGGYYINPALPAGLKFATATGVVSGTPTATSTAVNYKVTGYNNGGGKTATVNIKVLVPSSNANLSQLVLSAGTLSPLFAGGTTSYHTTVATSVTSITVTPTASNAFATINVNGISVASGAASPAFGLQPGVNNFTVTVIAQDGTFKEYTIAVTRTVSTNANLAGLVLSSGPLTPAFSAGTISYSASVPNATNSVTVTPTSADATATITVKGVTVVSGSASGAISLAIGSNNIPVVVTAQDGTTTKTYTITVNRPLSNVATLSALSLSAGTLAPSFAPATTSYTVSVANSVSSITLAPLSTDPDATVKVNGVTVARGNTSGAIPLNVGPNTITTVVTAQNGTTTDTYTVTVTRAASPNANLASVDPGISVTKPAETPTLSEDGVTVHPAISPNGDGINDFLQIDNIGNYPDNRLTVVNRNGQLVYEAKGYDNSSKTFDGHSNKNGQMQLPGTYFYQLDYTVNGVNKHKTGFIVLKY